MLDAATTHFSDLYNRYCKYGENVSRIPGRGGDGGVAVVNLLDKAGVQLRMGRDLSRALGSIGAQSPGSPPASEEFREELSTEDFRVPAAGGSARVRYLWYDYHYNTDHFGMQKADSLYWPLREYLEDGIELGPGQRGGGPRRGNFFLSDRDGAVRRLQKGVIRTNCIDCLDRTNVIQVGRREAYSARYWACCC